MKPMIPSQFVDKIHVILTGEAESLGAAEVAAGFAGACVQAKERLKVIQSLYDQGQAVEAMVEAEKQPPLLPFTEALLFSELDAWQARCREEGWPVGIPPVEGEIAVLRSLQSSALDVQVLQKALRRAAREKHTQRSVWILRKLRDLETDHPNHAQDLKEFERRRLQEIETESKTAFEEDRETDLLLLADEVMADGWLSEVPAGLLAKLKSAAASIRNREREKTVRQYVEMVSAAYAAGDWKKALVPAGEVEGLLKAYPISLPQDLQQEWEDNCHWLKQQKEADQKERLFQTKLEIFERNVAAGNVSKVEEELRELRLFEHPLPETLEEQAELLLENAEITKARKTKQLALMSTVSLLIIAWGGWSYARSQQLNRRTVERAEVLQTLIDDNDLESLQREADRLVSEEPVIAARPEIRDLVNLIPVVAERADIRKREFRLYHDQLQEKIKTDGLDRLSSADFALFSQNVTKTLEKLDGELAKSSEELEQLSQLQMNWSEIQENRQRVQRDLWRSWDAEFQPLVTRLESLHPQENESEIEEVLAAIRTMQLDVPEPHSETAAESLKNTLARIERARGKIGQLEEQLERILNAETLADYLREMEIFAGAYPTDPLAELMKPVLANKEHYLAFMTPPLQADTDNPFWGPLVQRQEGFETDQTEWTKIQQAIVGWSRDDRMVNIREITYWAANPYRRVTGIIEGPIQNDTPGGARTTDVNFFELVQNDRRSTPRFELTSIPNEDLRNARLLSYCKDIDEFVQSIRFADSSTAYHTLLTKSQDFLKLETVPILLRVELGSSLMRMLEALAPESHKQHFQTTLSILSQADMTLSWLCTKHPHYAAAERNGRQLIGNMLSTFNKLLSARVWAPYDQIHIQNNPIWYGFRSLDGASFPRKSNQVASEVWVVRMDNGKPKIMTAIVRVNNSTQTLLRPIPGEPVFAPGHRKTTNETFENFKNVNSTLTESDLRREPSWPSNFQSISGNSL